MKFFTTTLFAISLLAQTTIAQNPYYDALYLKGRVNSSGRIVLQNDVQELLAKYFPGTASFDITQSLLDANPFFTGIFKDKGSDAVENIALDARQKSFSLSAIGGLNVSAFADGLAKFLIKRAKEELFISFFSKLQDDQKFPEFKILFPNTKILVDNFKSWEYANIISTLREAFDKDIKQILADIPKLRTLNGNDYKGDVKKRVTALVTFLGTDNGRIFMSALEIGNGLISGSKIPDVIHIVAGADYLGGLPGASQDVKNTIRLLDILSLSVRSNEPGKSYVSFTDFSALMGSALSRKLYLGLIWQQLKTENIVIGQVNVATVLQTGNSVATYIESLVKQSIAITDAFNNLATARRNAVADLMPYWDAVFLAADEFFLAAGNVEIIDGRLVLPTVVKTALDMAHQSLTIAHDVAVRNYSAVIVGVVSLISEKVNTSSISGFKEFLVKYGSFAANVVQAKNSDEVAKAIESVALPVGSASIKKNTDVSIALNAYLGGFYGNEFIGDKKTGQWGVINGVYAPVGVTISTRIKTTSLSAFITLIDIGAFAAFRLKDQNTKDLPEVTFQNILAPGLGLVVGIPKWPLSIGYTYQLGPVLRKIDPAEIEVSEKMNKRWQFFLAVDIPLLNFYTKSN
jgi:hypothetical protein